MFIFDKRVNKYVRVNKGKPVELKVAKLPSSMVKFNNAYPIGFHKWAPGA